MRTASKYHLCRLYLIVEVSEASGKCAFERKNRNTFLSASGYNAILDIWEYGMLECAIMTIAILVYGQGARTNQIWSPKSSSCPMLSTEAASLCCREVSVLIVVLHYTIMTMGRRWRRIAPSRTRFWNGLRSLSYIFPNECAISIFMSKFNGSIRGNKVTIFPQQNTPSQAWVFGTSSFAICKIGTCLWDKLMFILGCSCFQRGNPDKNNEAWVLLLEMRVFKGTVKFTYYMYQLHIISNSSYIP